jgi:hypothetical protein
MVAVTCRPIDYPQCAVLLTKRKRIYGNTHLVACFLPGNSPAYEFYMPTSRNTLSIPSSKARRYEEWLSLRMLEYLYGKRFGSSQTFSHINTPTFSNLLILHTYPPMKMEPSIPKRRHIKFRRRRIAQKKIYNIQNTAKVWNQEHTSWLRIQYFRFLRRLSFKWRSFPRRVVNKYCDVSVERMCRSSYWLTTGSSGCWSKAEEESVLVLGEGLSEFGQSHFFHPHHLSHPVESIAVLERETARPSETLRHLTSVNPRLHLIFVSVFRS